MNKLAQHSDRPRPRASALPLVLAALLGLLAGCQHEVNPPPHPVGPGLSDAERADLAQRNAQVLEQANDPCAIRLQDLGGALAIFYHDHQGFPEKLEAVTPTALRWGINAQFTDPVTGEPFAYVASGLAGPGQLRRLLVYQQTPDDKGLRWGLVMSPPVQGMIVVTPEVVRLTPAVFNAYLQSAPKPPAPPAPISTPTPDAATPPDRAP